MDRKVEWREFKAAFRGHHIPAGIMDRKLNEFLALTQGNRIVLQYAQAFNDLCQYAGYHADTDEKKRDRFRRGLSTKLRDRLNTVRANSYNELVNMAISQEDCITARQAEKKRKTPVAGPSAQPQRFRIVSDTQNRGPQQQQGRWVIRPQKQRPSMTCASMPDITQTQTRRRGTGSEGGSALSSVIVSTPSGPTVTTSWSTWLSPRRTALQLDRQKRRGRPLWQGLQLSHSVSGLCLTLRTGGLSSNKDDG